MLEISFTSGMKKATAKKKITPPHINRISGEAMFKAASSW